MSKLEGRQYAAKLDDFLTSFASKYRDFANFQPNEIDNFDYTVVNIRRILDQFSIANLKLYEVLSPKQLFTFAKSNTLDQNIGLHGVVIENDDEYVGAMGKLGEFISHIEIKSASTDVRMDSLLPRKTRELQEILRHAREMLENPSASLAENKLVNEDLTSQVSSIKILLDELQIDWDQTNCDTSLAEINTLRRRLANHIEELEVEKTLETSKQKASIDQVLYYFPEKDIYSLIMTYHLGF